MSPAPPHRIGLRTRAWLARRKQHLAFRLILFCVALRLRWLAWRDPAFRKDLQRRNIMMVWRTHDGRIARWFHFSPNRVRSGSGLRERCDIAVRFQDADYGATTLIQLLDNQRLFFVGMRQGKIRLNGNIKGLLWFRTVSEYLVPGGVQIWRPRTRARREDGARRN
jgi:hypothetical protein